MYIVLYAVYIAYLAFDNKRQYKAHAEVQEVAEEIEHIEEAVEKKYPFVQLLDKTISLTYPDDKQVQSKYVYTFWMSIGWIVFLSWVLVES
jgi:hypothetical protein